MERLKRLWLLSNGIFCGGIIAGIISLFTKFYSLDSLVIILISLLGALYTMNEYKKEFRGVL